MLAMLEVEDAAVEGGGGVGGIELEGATVIGEGLLGVVQRCMGKGAVVKISGHIGGASDAEAECADGFFKAGHAIGTKSKIEIWPAAGGFQLQRLLEFLGSAGQIAAAEK